MQLQVKEGIDAVIVDSVLAIRKGLTGPESTPQSSTATEPAVTPAVPNGTTDGATLPIRSRDVTATANGVPVYADGNQENGAVFMG